jgi:hypothetical protein
MRKEFFHHSQGAGVDVKDVVSGPEDASNPTDDAMIAVLEDYKDDPVGSSPAGPLLRLGVTRAPAPGCKYQTATALRRTDQ